MYDGFVDDDSQCPKCGRKITEDWQTKYLDSFMEVWKKGDLFQYRKLEVVPESEKKHEMHLFRRLEEPVSNSPIFEYGRVPVHTSCDGCGCWLEGFALVEDGHFKGIVDARALEKMISGGERSEIGSGPKNRELSLPLETHFVRCSSCGRKTLVQIALFGVSHNLAVSTMCGDCIKKNGVNPEYKKRDPVTAEKIETWASTE